MSGSALAAKIRHQKMMRARSEGIDLRNQAEKKAPAFQGKEESEDDEE
jgi:hypothetical protein